jgi:hypothetical protein
VFSLAFGFLFRLADGPLLGGLLDPVVLRWLVWVGFSGAQCAELFCLMHGMIVLGMVSWLVLGSWLPCSLQLSHCRFLRQVTCHLFPGHWLVDLGASCAVKVLGRPFVNFGRSFG